MKLIINSIIMRLLGASSVDAIMASFTRTITKLETLADHEMAVSGSLDDRAALLRKQSTEAEALANEAADRAWEATAKAQRLKELLG